MACKRSGKNMAVGASRRCPETPPRDPAKQGRSSRDRQQAPQLCRIGEVSGDSPPPSGVEGVPQDRAPAIPRDSLSPMTAATAVADRLARWRMHLQMHRVASKLSDERRETLALVLSRLQRADCSGEGWAACCPAHRDNSPSLSIGIDPTDGRFLLYCHARCSFWHIVDALGMEPGEMFETKSYSVPAKGANSTTSPRASSGRKPRVVEPSHADPKWAVMQKHFRLKGHAHHVKRLAEQLKVSYESLQQIGVGWSVEESCWTFIERNGNGKPCGFIRRFEGGKKLAMQGSKRGLTIPKGWKEQEGPVLICEGLTDVAAAITYGKRAIGRPGVNSGLDDLTILLRDVREEIVMVADNDEHGGGRIGARQLAEKLGTALGRQIVLMAPPKGFKDIREFYTQKGVR